jgi:hypothetical protein
VSKTTTTSSSSSSSSSSKSADLNPAVAAQLGNYSSATVELIRKLKPNPISFDCNPKKARFFIIKSFQADDVHKSIKYGVWSSTMNGNKRLDQAYRESAASGPLYLLYSVNGSGCFSGVARMVSTVDFTKAFTGWSAPQKWPGKFDVQWIFVKVRFFVFLFLSRNWN